MATLLPGVIFVVGGVDTAGRALPKRCGRETAPTQRHVSCVSYSTNS